MDFIAQDLAMPMATNLLEADLARTNGWPQFGRPADNRDLCGCGGTAEVAAVLRRENCSREQRGESRSERTGLERSKDWEWGQNKWDVCLLDGCSALPTGR